MKALLSLFSLLIFAQSVIADIIECDNGDRYNGKVVSMDEKNVTLRNEIAGTISIPRNRIISISFRDQTQPRPVTAPIVSTNRPSAAQGFQFDSAAVQKVQNELLATATPEATQMFNEMVQGLMGGQMNVGDIRNKAQSTLQELRELQKDLGDDETAALLNSYGAILENFLRQSGASTNAAVPAPKPQQPAITP